MPKPFLKQRQVENAGLPDLKGRWSDQEGEKLTLTPVKGVNNTYSAVSDRGKETILLTVERLDQTRFVAQAAFAGSPGVLLTVAEISDRKVLVYLFPDSLEEMRKIGKENGVTITDKGLITKYENAQGIIAFFRRLASLPGRKDMEFTKN
ncbi:MAG: hypothetical protein LBW85_11160 [Deltaproteobacteria bacterium]|nr:hypothetical protein [Deltaproteobacteria bacterium]